ncbi:MAG TPA: CDP-diacylglycerol--glycerol-3-phosphate 3-phosphatidyltransferase [bacterium]|nr:CDP-diacylglycerol--glycerol-3-phosphate 3-phosphatidyltransferase [bacterium]HMW36516.1 CDP-diacylglycerol--glycerol-3-phosphate 3-phosphatidyltransferase [bacterium]HMZ03895.1 CDP-diacylglycerol--glycerol-3-phosphate 3-phosphatidyltransferase [bacterium]HNB55941.1 CDP-diacylglycerol--glycerol-3-phosphate 3-phosphatidyltransferase [bacterium]HND77373.1 CDP-diacylglycerol--glycerol-3-phosphate 3-phosphatidyltransferase [bacterium]
MFILAMRFIPNILTILRILLTPVFVFCLLSDEYQVYSVALFVFASVTDWVDGYLARKYSYHSGLGKFLDPLADKILVLSAFFSFVYLGFVKLWMVMVIVIRDFMITSLRSYAIRRGKPMMTNFFAKLKTAFQMLMIGLILIFIAMQSLIHMTISEQLNYFIYIVTHYEVIYVGMLVVTAVTVISGLLYLYENRESLRSLHSPSQVKNT